MILFLLHTPSSRSINLELDIFPKSSISYYLDIRRWKTLEVSSDTLKHFFSLAYQMQNFPELEHNQIKTDNRYLCKFNTKYK